MADKMVVLVTGVADYWGKRVCESLLTDQKYHVIGLDSEYPVEEIRGLDFIQADVRNPLLVELFKSEKVNTVCHLKFIERERPSEATFDLNVIGSMKVFGSCAEAGVQNIVFKSSTAVYGAQASNSAFLREDQPLAGNPEYGNTRHLVEIETFINGFRRQTPQIKCAVLRFANIVGPKASTPMTRYLSGSITPVLLGFDPMMQVIHENDVVGALVQAVINKIDGVYNVAADDVLPLNKLTALAGKIPIPVLHPIAYWGRALAGKRRLPSSLDIPFDPDYIRYPCVADIARMHGEMNFIPSYTSEETLKEFAGIQRNKQLTPTSASLSVDEDMLRDTIERRRRNRERIAANPSDQVEGENDE